MRKVLFFLFLFCFVSNISASSKINVKLDKCIDGDTARFFINGESKTVRFLSINAPEIAHDDVMEEFYGNEASDYTCKLLSRASSIKLQYDPKSDKVDKYDRVLAWIYVDGDLLQKELVSKGYAEVKYVYDDYLYSNDLKDLEIIAKDKKMGMWGNANIKSENIFEFISLHDLLTFGFIFLFFFIISLLKNILKKK